MTPATHIFALSPRDMNRIEKGLEMLALLADGLGVDDDTLVEICALRSRFLERLERSAAA